MSHAPGANVVPIDPDHLDQRAVWRVAEVLRGGGIVALPTETVYGLGCHAFDAKAVARVFAAKGRPATDPLIVHVDGPAQLATVTDGPLPGAAAALADAFWPGPLTLVVPRHPALPPSVTAGLDRVAVRAPSHPVFVAVLAECGFPIAAPSANRFGHVSPTSAAHVVTDLGDECDLIVDSGPCERGLESTVVTFTDDAAVVLRHGAVTIEALRAACPLPVLDVRADHRTAAASPGHDERHYSPTTPTVAVRAAVLDGATPLDGLPASGVTYVGYRDRPPHLPAGWAVESFGDLARIEDVARDLYATLRRVDEGQPERIVVELTGVEGLGRAIDDRLTRAASSRVTDDVGALAAALART